MRRLIHGVVLVLLFVCAPDVLAARPLRRALVPQSQGDQANVGVTSFWQRDLRTWEIIADGAWGRMKYRSRGSTFGFRFKGEGLRPGGDYTMIYYPDYEGGPWRRRGIRCLGSGTATGVGYIELAEARELDSDLPMPGDMNPGAKIVLVDSSDVDCSTNTMSGWDPIGCLFGHNLITYSDTDLLQARSVARKR